MKTHESKTSTGGTLVEYFDDQGNRIRAVHTQGRNEPVEAETEESPGKTRRCKNSRSVV